VNTLLIMFNYFHIAWLGWGANHVSVLRKKAALSIKIAGLTLVASAYTLTRPGR
jgi:hypothetical protein